MDIQAIKDEGTEIQSQAQLWKFIYGFPESLVLRSAVEMGIADIIHQNAGKISLSQLALRLSIPNVRSDYLYRVMRFLVHMRIFKYEETADAGKFYGLEPAAKFLLKDGEESMAPIILGMTHQEFMVPWHFMKDGLGDKNVAFEKAMGMTIWDYLGSHPEKSQLFNEAMAAETRLLTDSLIRGCNDLFKSIGSLVDVGGGNGTALKAIYKAFPHIKCTVFDLPHVVASSAKIPGFNFVAGDMFMSVPSAQAILLKLILHDWSDEDCIKILKQCKEAVPVEEGKVIIVDVVLDDHSEHELSKPRMVLDIDMMVYTGGKERTEDGWKDLIHRAGYKGHKIREIDAVQSVIEAYPY